MDEKWYINLIKKLDFDEQRLYINLYKNYVLINKNYLQNEKYSNIDNALDKLEDKIYSIKGRTLTQVERISLELKNIERYLSRFNNLNSKTRSKVCYELDMLHDLISSCSPDNSEIFSYCKKRISILQALLGMEIKFFDKAVEAFEEQIELFDFENDKYKK